MSITIRVSTKCELETCKPNITTTSRIKVIKRDELVPDVIVTEPVPVHIPIHVIRDNWVTSKNATQDAELSQMRAFLFGGTN